MWRAFLRIFFGRQHPGAGVTVLDDGRGHRRKCCGACGPAVLTIVRRNKRVRRRPPSFWASSQSGRRRSRRTRVDQTPEHDLKQCHETVDGCWRKRKSSERRMRICASPPTRSVNLAACFSVALAEGRQAVGAPADGESDAPCEGPSPGGPPALEPGQKGWYSMRNTAGVTLMLATALSAHAIAAAQAASQTRPRHSSIIPAAGSRGTATAASYPLDSNARWSPGARRIRHRPSWAAAVPPHAPFNKADRSLALGSGQIMYSLHAA